MGAARAGQDVDAARHAAPALARTSCRSTSGAQAALKPRYEQKSWLQALQAHAGGRAGASSTASRRRCATARSRARSWPTRVHEGLRRGYGDLLKPVAFRGELIFADSAGQNVRFALPEPFEPMDDRGGHEGDRAPLPHALRPGHAARSSRSGSAARRRPSAGAGSRRSATRWSRPSSAGRWRATSRDLEAAAPSGVVNLLPAFDQYVVAAPRDTRATSRARADLPPGRLVLARPARRRRDGRRLEPRGRHADDRAVRARRRRRAREAPRPRPRGSDARRHLAGLISAPRRRSSPSPRPTAPAGARSAPRWPSASASSSSTARSRPGRRPAVGAARRRARPRRVARRRDRALRVLVRAAARAGRRDGPGRLSSAARTTGARPRS